MSSFGELRPSFVPSVSQERCDELWWASLINQLSGCVDNVWDLNQGDRLIGGESEIDEFIEAPASEAVAFALSGGRLDGHSQIVRTRQDILCSIHSAAAVRPSFILR